LIEPATSLIKASNSALPFSISSGVQTSANCNSSLAATVPSSPRVVIAMTTYWYLPLHPRSSCIVRRGMMKNRRVVAIEESLLASKQYLVLFVVR
jgi:hypothetical protein